MTLVDVFIVMYITGLLLEALAFLALIGALGYAYCHLFHGRNK